MKQTRDMWDMHITVSLRDGEGTPELVEEIFSYFRHIDDVFNTYRQSSEISRINRGEILPTDWSPEVNEVIHLCEQTHMDTNGYFSYIRDGEIHPLGLVKGWAIHNAAESLNMKGIQNFFIDAGGDVEVRGYNDNGLPWSVGIRDPFYREDIIKKLLLTDCGIATSGTYIRGNHIYNPIPQVRPVTDVVSLTVIGPNVFEADRFVTAAFAMGKKGIEFIESVRGLEGYLIDDRGMATYTSGFDRYVH